MYISLAKLPTTLIFYSMLAKMLSIKELLSDTRVSHVIVRRKPWIQIQSTVFVNIQRQMVDVVSMVYSCSVAYNFIKLRIPLVGHGFFLYIFLLNVTNFFLGVVFFICLSNIDVSNKEECNEVVS